MPGSRFFTERGLRVVGCTPSGGRGGHAKDSRPDTSRLPAQHLTHSLFVAPKSQGLHEVTDDIAAWLVDQPMRNGLLTVFIRHTSASLLIQENVDPDVTRDIENFLMKLVPEESSLYRHNRRGARRYAGSHQRCPNSDPLGHTCE